MLKVIDVEAFGVEITAWLTTGVTLKYVCQLAGSSDAWAYLGTMLIHFDDDTSKKLDRFPNVRKLFLC